MSPEKIVEIIKSHTNHCGDDANEMYALGYQTCVANIIRDINGAYQREFNGEMTELGERNYLLISEAIKMTGEYDPNEILCIFEERLYIHEADTIVNFLTWIVEGGYEMKHGIIKMYHRGFGHGNYEERFQEFLNDTK